MSDATQTSLSYFVILDLDPDAEWDQARFEKALKDKRTAWSRDSSKGAGARKKDAERNIKLIPKILADMADPATRERHAEIARQVRESGAKEAAERFETELQVKAARGHLFDVEVAELVRIYGPVLGEAEVRKRLVGVLVKGAEAAAPGPTPIDSSKRRQIDSDLARAGKRTLYEFLQDDASTAHLASTEVLLARARAIYDGVSKSANKTPELTLRQEIAGYCLEFFGSEDQRARYDAALAGEKASEILEKARLAAGHTHELTTAQVQLLLEDASRSGLDPEEMRARLVAHAKREKWAIEVPAPGGRVVCACGELNDETARCCRACGEALRLPCPRCSATMPSGSAACTQCGFPLGNRFLVRALLDEARDLAASGALRDAGERLAEAARAWPASGPDPLAGEIAGQQRTVRETEAAGARAVEEVRALLASRRFYTAETRVQELRTRGTRHPELADLGARARRGVESADAALRELQQLALAGEEAAERCQRILLACDDCEPARRILEGIPPVPPSGLAAQARGGVVALTWRGSASHLARYAVLRKAGSRPSGIGDGVRLATVEDTRYDDAAPEVGVDLYYAIFTERGGVPSRGGAHLAAPVLVLAEVGDLVVRPGDGEVRLAWNPPPNAARVFALRSEAGAGPRVSAVRLDSADGRQIVDRGVVNGREYRYTVHCEFRNGAGDPAVSSGVEVAVTPQVSLLPIETLEFAPAETTEGRRVLRVSWPPPPKGEVRILVTGERVPFAGEAVPVRELARGGDVLSAVRPPVIGEWHQGGMAYFTPAVVLGETAYVGRSHLYVFLDDVADLKAVNLGDRVRVTWDWPKGCLEAELSCGIGGWPDAEDASGPRSTLVVSVSRAEYDRAGGCEIRPHGGSDLFVVVRAAAVLAGERTLSGGTSSGARGRIRLQSRVTLQYEVLAPGILRRTPRLRLWTSQQAEVPPLRLVRKRGTLPQDRADGECVLRLGRTRIDREAVFPLDGVARDGRGFVRLFLESDEHYDSTTILHPDRDKLLL